MWTLFTCKCIWELALSTLLVYVGKNQSLPALGCDVLDDHLFKFCTCERRQRATKVREGNQRMDGHSRTEWGEANGVFAVSHRWMEHLYYGPWTTFQSWAVLCPTLRLPFSKVFLLRQPDLEEEVRPLTSSLKIHIGHGEWTDWIQSHRVDFKSQFFNLKVMCPAEKTATGSQYYFSSHEALFQ